MKKKSTDILVRIEPAAKEALSRLAAADKDRPLSAYVRNLIHDHIADKQKLGEHRSVAA